MGNDIVECESCLVAGEHRPATGRAINPDWSGYDLCDECRAEYDSRIVECESCRVAGEHRPATGRSSNPDWSGYDLCDECRAEYDSRPPDGYVAVAVQAAPR